MGVSSVSAPVLFICGAILLFASGTLLPHTVPDLRATA